MIIKIKNDDIQIISKGLKLHDFKSMIDVDLSEFKDSSLYTYQIDFNGIGYKELDHNKITFSHLIDLNKNVIIRVKATKLTDGSVIHLHKEFPYQTYFNIGKPLKQPYEPVIQQLINSNNDLLSRVNSLEIALAKKISEGDIF